MQTKLWNKNFLLYFLGNIFSAVGSVVLSATLSIVIFEETQSTVLAALFMALQAIPHFLIPITAGPLIDRRNPKNVLVLNEVILAFVFFATGILTWRVGFSYIIFLVFSLLINCFGVVSQLSSQSIFPQIISKENYMRGNSMINIIYPLCSVAVTPIAIVLVMRYGIPVLLIAHGVLSLIDAFFESRIKTDFEYIASEKATFADYRNDLKSGFSFYKNDPAIRAVFLLFTLVMFAGASTDVLTYPFFSRSEVLDVGHYAILASVRGAGYVVGGFLHYFIKIPETKRYKIAITVYFIFVVLDGIFFLTPFPVMCASRFILGILGMNSANIRISAIQARVPNTMRAKLNALFSMMIALSTLAGQMIVGALGEVMPYWLIQILFQLFYLAGILIFALPKKNKVKELYNYSSEAAEE